MTKALEYLYRGYDITIAAEDDQFCFAWKDGSRVLVSQHSYESVAHASSEARIAVDTYVRLLFSVSIEYVENEATL